MVCCSEWLQQLTTRHWCLPSGFATGCYKYNTVSKNPKRNEENETRRLLYSESVRSTVCGNMNNCPMKNLPESVVEWSIQK